MTLTVGSLFSGIGGLDLGLERAGMQVIWQSEIDPYACKVLSKHWPEVVNHGNIKEINWKEIERPDVICGGYPCQPFSTAGKRRGEEDPRHLWPWVREAISQLRPRYAILENVRGHLSMGGLSVIGELASIGYDAEWRIVSAASVGANHRRDRIIIVAYPTSQCGNGFTHNTRDSQQSESTTQSGNSSGTAIMAYPDGSPGQLQQKWQVQKPNFGGCSQNVADTDDTGNGTPGCNADGNGETIEQGRQNVSQFGTSGCSENVADTDLRKVGGGDRWHAANRGAVFSGQHKLRGTQGYEGGQWWQIEPDVGRVADGIPARVDRLRGLGNAVVPQVAEVIGRMVVAHAETI